MKREQNNGQREGKVLINSSTSLVLALDCVAFTLSWKWSVVVAAASLVAMLCLQFSQDQEGAADLRKF